MLKIWLQSKKRSIKGHIKTRTCCGVEIHTWKKKRELFFIGQAFVVLMDEVEKLFKRETNRWDDPNFATRLTDFYGNVLFLSSGKTENHNYYDYSSAKQLCGKNRQHITTTAMAATGLKMQRQRAKALCFVVYIQQQLKEAKRELQFMNTNELFPVNSHLTKKHH